MRRLAKWFILIILGIVLLVFMLSNRGAVTISLYPLPYEIDMPLFLVFVAVFLLGLFFGGIVGRWRGFALRHRLKEAELRISALKKEVAATKAATHITHSLVALDK